MLAISERSNKIMNMLFIHDIKKWRSGTGAIGYHGIAEYDGDEWNIKQENMWIS